MSHSFKVKANTNIRWMWIVSLLGPVFVLMEVIVIVIVIAIEISAFFGANQRQQPRPPPWQVINFTLNWIFPVLAFPCASSHGLLNIKLIRLRRGWQWGLGLGTVGLTGWQASVLHSPFRTTLSLCLPFPLSPLQSSASLTLWAFFHFFGSFLSQLCMCRICCLFLFYTLQG